MITTRFHLISLLTYVIMLAVLALLALAFFLLRPVITSVSEPSHRPSSPTATSSPSETRRPPTSKLIIYTNTSIGFQMVFPAGWQVPPEDSPIAEFFYNCRKDDTSDCEAAIFVWEVDERYELDYARLIAASGTSNQTSIEILDNFIPNSKVVKVFQRRPQQVEWPYGFDWPYGYFVFPTATTTQFILATDNAELSEPIIRSFKPLGN